MGDLTLVLETGIRAFESELGRSERLTNKAEKYLGGVALVTGFASLQMDDLLIRSAQPPGTLIWLLGPGFLALALSILLAMLSLSTREYLGYPDGETIVAGLDASRDSEDMTLKLSKMYFDAHAHNAAINTGRSALLTWSGYCLVTGFALALLTVDVSEITQIVDSNRVTPVFCV